MVKFVAICLRSLSTSYSDFNPVVLWHVLHAAEESSIHEPWRQRSDAVQADEIWWSVAVLGSVWRRPGRLSVTLTSTWIHRVQVNIRYHTIKVKTIVPSYYRNGQSCSSRPRLFWPIVYPMAWHFQRTTFKLNWTRFCVTDNDFCNSLLSSIKLFSV